MLLSMSHRAGLARPLIAVVLLLGMVDFAFADPRLVRLVWDVGGGVVYARAESRTTPNHGVFQVPASRDAVLAANFVVYETSGALRKGDRVRLHIVNYNPVAHVWHESSTVEQIAPEPSVVGAVLSSLLLGAVGGKPFPAAALAFAGGAAAAAAAAGSPCLGVPAAYDALSKAAVEAQAGAAHALATAKALDFATQAKRLADVPKQPLFFDEFDNGRAWQLIRFNERVFGRDFAEDFAGLRSEIRTVAASLRTANEALIVFGTEYAKLDPATAENNCKVYADQREIAAAVISAIGASDSAFGLLAASYAKAAELWALYGEKLATVDWAEDAVEVIVKEPVIADGVLRVDGVFASPDKTVTIRQQRNLALRVETHFPRLAISSGVGFNQFKFKKLQVAQTTATVDNVLTAKSQLTIVDDTTWERIMPVWTQNILILPFRNVGLYGVFGTTPDRNIFKNAIMAGSLVVPKWKTSFAAGWIFAKGYEEQDLVDIKTRFTDASEILIKDADLAKLPMPKTPWKKAVYASVTFLLLSF